MFSLVARRLDWNQHAPIWPSLVSPFVRLSFSLQRNYLLSACFCCFFLVDQWFFYFPSWHMWRCLNCSEIEFLKNFKKFWLEDEKFEIFLIQKCPTFRPARWISIRSLTHPAHVVRSPILGYLISFLKFHCNRIKKTLCSSLFCAEFRYWRQFSNVWKRNYCHFLIFCFFHFTGSMIRIVRWLCRR
jgi:hypothetical protein